MTEALQSPNQEGDLSKKTSTDTKQKIKFLKEDLKKYYYLRFGLSFTSAVVYVFSDEFLLFLLFLPLSLAGSIWRFYLNFNEYNWLNNKHLNIQLKVCLNFFVAFLSGIALAIAMLLAFAATIAYLNTILPIALSIIYGGKFFLKTFQAILWFRRALNAELGTIRYNECWGRAGKYGFSALYCLGTLVLIALTTFTGVITGGTDKIAATFAIIGLAGLNTFYDPVKDFFRGRKKSREKKDMLVNLKTESENDENEALVLNRQTIVKHFDILLDKNALEKLEQTDINSIETKIKNTYKDSAEFFKTLTAWHRPGAYEGKFGDDDLSISLNIIQKYCEIYQINFEQTGKDFVLAMILKKIETYPASSPVSTPFTIFTNWFTHETEKNRNKKIFLEWLHAWVTETDTKPPLTLGAGENQTNNIIHNMDNLFLVLKTNPEFSYNAFSSNFEGSNGEVGAMLELVMTYYKIVEDNKKDGLPIKISPSTETISTDTDNTDSSISSSSSFGYLSERQTQSDNTNKAKAKAFWPSNCASFFKKNTAEPPHSSGIAYSSPTSKY
jgi:hypothetical protein